MSKHLVDPFIVFFVIFHVRWKEKKQAKVFSSLERLPCFWQLCVFNNLLDPKKRRFIFQSKCQNSLWTLIKCSLMFVTLDDTRKKGQKLFHRENCSFFKNVCFYRHLRSQGNDLIILKFFSEYLWTLIQSGTPWCLSHSMNWGKTGQKLLSLLKQLFLKCLFLSPSLVPKKCSYHLRNRYQNALRTLIKCSLTFVMFDNTRKIDQIFSSLERLPFFQNFVFSTTS